MILEDTWACDGVDWRSVLKVNAIAFPVVALVCGLLAGPPSRFKCFCESRAEVAKQMVKKLANEAYPQWQLRPGNANRCPWSADLGEFVNSKDLKDPWGNEYQFHCADLRGVTYLYVWSFGDDGKPGTGDDLKSWE